MSGSHGRVDRTFVSFAEATNEIVRARQIGVRRLAREVGASPSHVSRILRGAQDKQPSLELLERVTAALELPAEYFLEVRRARVIAEIQRTQRL